ncbi:Uncharacterised protein [uncultured archaeon]|nr:Uncharacterised protein [uncultured archaeon]
MSGKRLVINKKGQVTIFIIIAVIMVGTIVTFFVLRSGVVPQIGGQQEKSPSSFLQTCLENKIAETTKLISSQGGYLSNSLNKTFKFTGATSYVGISYLCYTNGYYVPCINQQPMLISHLKKEVKDHISKDVKNCFDALGTSLTQQGYTVDSKYSGFDVELTDGRIKVPIDGKITLSKTGETSNYDNLNVSFQSKFYDTAIVVQEIVSQEARFCNFEYLGFMLLYPQWEIHKLFTSDSTRIYTVKNIGSADTFNFAVRGCVTRPGL